MKGANSELKGNWQGGTIRIHGHVYIYRPEHPRAQFRNRYVPRSIIVWEEANGLPFPDGKIPHHDNRIPDDDRPENIIPLTRGEHVKEHSPARRKQGL